MGLEPDYGHFHENPCPNNSTVDKEVKLVTEGQSVYIPIGAIHRLENPGKVPLIVIEIQTGVYLGEDDLIRFEDIYNRV